MLDRQLIKPATARDSALGVEFNHLVRALFAIIIGAALPWAVIAKFVLQTPLDAATFVQVLAPQALAILYGDYMLRRLTIFPGSRASSYIIPVFSAGYGVLLIFYVFARIPYSRSQLILSFAIIIGLYFLYYSRQQRKSLPRFAVIPGGNAADLFGVGRFNGALITRPYTGIGEFDGVAVDFTADLDDSWERFIAEQVIAGVPVYHSKQVLESLAGEVSIERLSENSFGSLIPSLAYFSLKTGIDRAFALLLLIPLLPLLLLVALLIRLDSPGGALFSQTRIGYRGRPFKIYKFRSMVANHAVDGPTLDSAKTDEGDMRVTNIGRFLRRTRIDELPQIINILKGEMSWIGPRPEAEVLSRWYDSELPFYSYRHIVKPGITGWAQVNQGHVTELDDVLGKLRYDFFYIKYFSPSLDFLILLRTVRVIVQGLGWR